MNTFMMCIHLKLRQDFDLRFLVHLCCNQCYHKTVKTRKASFLPAYLLVHLLGREEESVVEKDAREGNSTISFLMNYTYFILKKQEGILYFFCPDLSNQGLAQHILNLPRHKQIHLVLTLNPKVISILLH